jgi:hypothetical protein
MTRFSFQERLSAWLCAAGVILMILGHRAEYLPGDLPIEQDVKIPSEKPKIVPLRPLISNLSYLLLLIGTGIWIRPRVARIRWTDANEDV